MKVKIMIMLAAICFAIIPMVICAALANIFISNDANSQYRKEVSSIAQSQVHSLEMIIDIAKNDINKLASYDYIKTSAQNSAANEEADNFISNFGNSSGSLIDAVRLVDAAGNVISGTDTGKTLANFSKYAQFDDDTLYFDTVASGNNANKSMFIKKKIGDCTLLISYNASSSNSPLAKIASNSVFDTMGNKSNGQIVILDSRGNWSVGSSNFYSDFEKTYGSEVANRIDVLEDNDVMGTFMYKNDNGNNFGAMVRVGGENGLIALCTCSADRSGIFVSGPITPIVAATVLLAILSFIIAIVVSRGITSPLKKIEETLERIRRGDHEARIGNITTNEYGQLSRAFNSLVDEIVVSEDRYRTISDMSDNIIFEWNFKTNEVIFSNNFNKKFSYRPPSDHFGDSFLLKAKIHPDDADRYRSDLDGLEKGRNFERNEYRIKNIYGDFIWVLMRTATLRDKDGNPLKVVGVLLDIDRAKKSEQQLTERASYDALTELYNRETIESQIDNEISLSEMRKSEMAVLFIDVDDFKHFNDNYSHATGDQVLKFVAKTIRESVNDIGFAGRYGGDEFIAMIRNAETNEPALIAQKIIDTLSAGFDADIGERLAVSVSIGIAVIKDDYNTRVEYLIGKADDAMYSVKKNGKSAYAFI